MLLNEIEQLKFPEKTLIMPIGPSGAGKSTLFKTLQASNNDIKSFSLDTLRHEWYDPNDYKTAFEKSCADKSFERRANAAFEQAIAQGGKLYVDNTNLSPKRRKFYLDLAATHGYHTVAFILTTSVDEMVRRQTTRGDKYVPENVVRNQYNSMVLPVSGEFDKVIMVHNGTKDTSGQENTSGTA